MKRGKRSSWPHGEPGGEPGGGPGAAGPALALLLLLNVLNFVDRQLVASLGFQIERELGLDHATLGLLQGSLFIVFFALMNLVAGSLADRVHRPRLIACGLVLWSALTAVSGAAQRFAHLAAARMFVGVGEATLNPAALGILSDLHPPERRARAVGIYYAGIPIGAGLSFLLVGWLEPILGWRGCFYLLGGVGVVFVVPLLRLGDPPRGGLDAAPTAALEPGWPSRAQLAEVKGVLLSSPALILMMLGGVLSTYAHSSHALVIVWLQAERGFDLPTAALRSGVIVLGAGLVGSVLGGALGDRLERRRRGGRMRFLAAAQLLFGAASLAFLAVDPTLQPVAFHGLWILDAVGNMIVYGPLLAATLELIPARIRSSVLAVLLFLVNLLGIGTGPALTGWIGDRVSLTAGLATAIAVGMASAIFFALAGRALARRRGADAGLIDASRP